MIKEIKGDNKMSKGQKNAPQGKIEPKSKPVKKQNWWDKSLWELFGGRK
jgi:hypothetical protein